MIKMAFIVPHAVELLDLADPVQVFTEARSDGLDVNLEFYSYHPDIVCSSNLAFGKMAHFSEADLKEGDFIFIPGMDYAYVSSFAFKTENAFFKWIKTCLDKKIIICSICTGAFFLGQAGLLDGIECTTHWRRIPELRRRFPKAIVISDILFVKSNNIYTSAGISSGIDLALSILEDLKGPLFTHKVARGLVVYHRRNHDHKQESIYLDYRNHISPQVHEVQDYLIDHLSEENSMDTLSALVAMSPRNLSRVFKEKTGTTVLEYLTRLRIENAKTLLNNPRYTMEYIAAQCGFKTARQLHRILKN